MGPVQGAANGDSGRVTRERSPVLLKGWDVACGELGSWRLGQGVVLPGG